MTGTSASCVSMSCSACTLNSRDLARRTTAQVDSLTCGPADVDEAAVALRVAEIAAYRLALGLPRPSVSQDGGEAWAPRGYDLVLERIGGRDLVYVVSEGERGAGADGKLLGPATTGDQPVQAMIGKPRVKCRCSGEGGCSFTRDDVCVPDSTCSGGVGCSVIVRGVRSLADELGDARQGSRQ